MILECACILLRTGLVQRVGKVEANPRTRFYPLDIPAFCERKGCKLTYTCQGRPHFFFFFFDNTTTAGTQDHESKTSKPRATSWPRIERRLKVERFSRTPGAEKGVRWVIRERLSSMRIFFNGTLTCKVCTCIVSQRIGDQKKKKTLCNVLLHAIT